MTLASTQSLTETVPGRLSWGKGGRCVGLTTLPLSCADCHEIWEPQPPGTLRACTRIPLLFIALVRLRIFVSTDRWF